MIIQGDCMDAMRECRTIDVKCGTCGVVFKDFVSNKRKYCSVKCAAKRLITERPKCKLCEQTVSKMRNIYCSYSCRNKDLGFQQRGITSYSGLYWKLQKLFPTPEPCAECGDLGKHRHHPDYNKPFDIVWLCAACHRREYQLGRKREDYKDRNIEINIPVSSYANKKLK